MERLHFGLSYKRLETGKFVWPGIHDGVMRLSRAQFGALFDAMDWRRMMTPRVQRPAVTE